MLIFGFDLCKVLMQSDVIDPGQLDLKLQNLTRVRERDLQTE